MMLAQGLLIAAFLLLFVVGMRSGHGISASRKLGFIALMGVVLVAVLSPPLVNSVALFVGIGRGTDLVLYLLAVAFGYYVVSDYLKAQDSRAQLYRLARRIAILEAQDRYGVQPRTRALDESVEESGEDSLGDREG